MNILITGATSGIGKDLAYVLAYLGHHVYACCHTEEEVQRKRKEQIQNLEYLKLDISEENDYTFLSELSIDCLVNQAGIGIGGSLLDIDSSEIEKNFQVNVFSTLKLTKFFIADCHQKKKPGKVLITSSLAGYFPFPFMGSYVATKASLTILTKILREEIWLSNLDIEIKLILPGAYHTGFNQHMLDFIEKSSYFPQNEKNWNRMQQLFRWIEKKNTHSIVNQMVKAIVSNSSKFIYSAPFSQRVFTRIYRILSK